MGYRQVVIKKCEKLNLEDRQLVINKDNNTYKVPLEDINFVLIEDNRTIITLKILAAFGEEGICLIVCDDKFEPVSIMYPYNYHFKQLENIEKQLSLDDDSKKIIWQEIVKSKIENEIAVLCQTSKDERVIDILSKYVKEVTIGDETNREGLAAKIYFRSLFGSEFIRFYDDPINAALNYAYQIVKSSIIRTLSIYGLNSYLGINHKSKVNNFNLVYDLIEPFRAIVDLYVYKIKDNLTLPLSFDVRKDLVNILNISVTSNNKKCTLEYSIELLVISYIKALSTGEVSLTFPRVIE